MNKNEFMESLNELRKLITNLTNDNNKLNSKIFNLETTISDLQNEISHLKYENSCIKRVLSINQGREQSKNFLKNFKKYLTEEDKIKITEDKNKKGDIMANRIYELFKDEAEQKKLSILTNLIRNSFNCINKVNYSANLIYLDNYEEEIKEYKEEKNIAILFSIEIFCFLISIQIEEDYFDEYFDYLKKYFDNNLDLKFCEEKVVENFLGIKDK